MWEHILLGIIGLSGGAISAGGLVALMIELKIIPRYAGITHTADQILLYEDCVVGGTLLGTFMTLYPVNLSVGRWLLYLMGLFGGIFIGSWIIALTEVLDIIPIMARRVGMKKGFSMLIVATALGKAIFSLIFYYHRW